MYSDEMCKKILEGGINRILYDGIKSITRHSLWVYGEQNWHAIMQSIQEWVIQFEQYWSNSLDQLDDYLKNLQSKEVKNE